MMNAFSHKQAGLVSAFALPQGTDLLNKWVAGTRDKLGHALILLESAIISQMTTQETHVQRYYQYALWLGLITVFYNLLEGLASIFFGIQDETLTLLGFGVDSFIEILSGIGIISMVLRIRHNPDVATTSFENNALRVIRSAHLG
jgi:hypothetical protein